jgi:hypothetical protein
VAESATRVEPELVAWIEGLAPCVAVNAKVYPFAAVPQQPTWPFVTYHRVSGSRVRSLKGPVGVSRPSLQLDVFGKTYKSATELASAIREELDQLCQTTLPSNGRPVQFTAVEDDGDAFEEPPHGDEVTQYRVTLPVRIWFRES